MISIKILCHCGTKYSFEADPVDGQLPAPVACPKCGADGTPAANESIRLQLMAAGVAAAPTPASEPAAPSLVPKPPSGVRLRVAGGHAGNEQTTAESPPDVVGAIEPPAVAPVAAVARKKNKQKKSGDPEEDMGKFALGVTGAFVGAAIGAIAYYLIFNAGFENKLVAIGVGGLTGLAGRYIGRQGSSELGMLAGALAIAAIFGAQYFVAKKWFYEADEEFLTTLYTAMVDTAKKAVTAIPNGTDEEVRKYLAQEYSDEDEEPMDPAEITAEEIAGFKQETLPMYQDLASGRLTQEDWARRFESDEEEPDAGQSQEDAEEEERTFKWIFLALTLSKFNLVCMAGAAGLAYKIGDS